MRRTPWVLVEPGVVEQGTVLRLDRDESRHLSSVLRSRAGDAVVVADGCGVTADAVIRSVARAAAELEIGQVRREVEPDPPGLTIGLGVLHGAAMDWAVQKAVEVGVAVLLPVCTERSQVATARARGRVGHWRRIARQALKQCHRAWAMEVRDPLTVADLLESREGRPGVVADAMGVSPRDTPREGREVLLVGPEGGLTDDELGVLEQRGWSRVCLGRHVLRAETAATVGAALLLQAE